MSLQLGPYTTEEHHPREYHLTRHVSVDHCLDYPCLVDDANAIIIAGTGS